MPGASRSSLRAIGTPTSSVSGRSFCTTSRSGTTDWTIGVTPVDAYEMSLDAVPSWPSAPVARARLDVPRAALAREHGIPMENVDSMPIEAAGCVVDSRLGVVGVDEMDWMTFFCACGSDSTMCKRFDPSAGAAEAMLFRERDGRS